MEVGSLSVPVRADLGPITQDLNRLNALLNQTQGQTQGLSNAVQNVQGQASSLTSALRPLAGALAGVFGTQQLIQFTNTWTDLNSRVTLAAGSVERGAAVIEQLQVIARRTYSSLEQTTESYIRNAQTLRDLGKSTQETLDYTEALNNALVVSGARGDHAASVQDALGKAMAMGKLSGDELNTVMTRGGRVAELLAERFGTAVSGLRQLGTDSKITGDVINEVLVGNLEKLRKEAEDMPATIGDAFLLIRNSLLQTIGVFDQTNEISGTLASALIFVADNMQRVISAVVAGTAVWGTYRAAIILVNSGLFTMTGLLAAVRVAIRAAFISTGIGILVVAVTELVNALWTARDASESWGEAFQKIGDAFPLVTYAMRTSFEGALQAMQSAWDSFASYVLTSMSNIASALGATLDVTQLVNDFDTSARQNLTGAAIRFGDAAEALQLAYKKIQGAAPGGVNLSGDGGVNKTTPAVDPAAKRAADRAAREAERLREQYKSLISDGNAFIEQQGIEQQAIGKTELEAAKLRATFDLLNQARRAGINLTPTQVAELTTLGESMAEAEYQTRKLQERYDFAKDTFKGFFTDMKSELQNGASIWEAFGTAAANALQKIADRALDLALNGIFDIIFGAVGGGAKGGGNFFTRLLGFENGTSYAPGGMAIVGERGPELVRLPGGSQVTPNHRVIAPSTPSFGSGGTNGQNSRVELDVFVKDDGKIGAIARQEAGSVVDVRIQEYDANVLPGSVQRVRENPRIRG